MPDKLVTMLEDHVTENCRAIQQYNAVYTWLGVKLLSCQRLLLLPCAAVPGGCCNNLYTKLASGNMLLFPETELVGLKSYVNSWV